ncbi:MAG TPA: C45 family autoproteolytic acyltransferase/hydrolase [Candidatus Hydrogenedentes bacterium]|nr:C45 family autoproteolytic acyltransferase/hydrolase [Candidatus Hydrogenedentota bacterium]
MSTIRNLALETSGLECAGGTLVRRKGIYIVQLRGSYADMGRQHAELTSQVCGDIVFQYMNGLIKKLVAHAVPSLAGPADSLLKRWFHWRNRADIDENMRALLRAMAKVSGLDPVQAEHTFLISDILHYLAGRSLALLAPSPMCSGFFACGDATKDGKVLIGRNFDFFGRGVWNTNNAIIVLHPEHGQRFCWLGALSTPVSGQGFNESGLVLSLHTKFTRDVCTKGAPLFTIVHDVLARCKTLDEAIARITAKPRMVGLTIFVADTRARTAAAVGFSAHHAEIVRPENGVLVRTNHYTTEEMKRMEPTLHSWRANSYGRFQRLTELLHEKRGTLTVEDVPKLLSDCVDPFEQRKRVTGSIVAGANNVQSIVMSPDDNALWLANGDYPVCHSERYYGFRISALLDGDAAQYEIDDLPGGNQLNETERAAVYEYEQAWSAYLDHLDSSQAVFHLLRATELLPEEVIFPRMAGIILLKEKKFEPALPLLLRNTEYDYRDAIMRAEAHVWAARCLDLLGRRDEAAEHYKIAAAIDAPPVSNAAKRHLTKAFRRRELMHVAPEFIIGTGLAKY